LLASLRPSSRARVSGVVVALVLLAAACGSSSKSGSSGGGTGASVTLNGSGSTFQKTFNQVTIAAFHSQNPNVTINYAGGGSGKGKTDLQTKTVDFAGTDSLIKDADKPKYQGGTVLYFPTVVAPITLSYNVSGLHGLKLSAPTIAKIFEGKASKWNDTAIAADNPGTSLPSTSIIAVHRADASGTTNNFTHYLTLAGGPEWTLGTGDTVNWPSGTGALAATGNQGVATTIQQNQGAIGYVDYSDAVAANLSFAAIKNSSGDYLAPTLAGASAAADGATIKPDLTYSPLNSPGAAAYPITSPTWIIVYEKQTDKNKGTALKDYLTFVLSSDGQKLAQPAKYAPLPASLLQKANAQLSQLQIPA
jgi:phosphate transport system substrate-binding protein